MMCGTAEKRVLEWRATVKICQNSKNKWLLHTNMSLFLCFLRHGMLIRRKVVDNEMISWYNVPLIIQECFKNSVEACRSTV